MTIEDKYPESCLDHFIAMFFDIPNRETLSNHVELAVSMEGKEYLQELLEELNKVISKGDEMLFVERANESEIKSFSKEHLYIIKEQTEMLLKEGK